jgi:hypothetical protein
MDEWLGVAAHLQSITSATGWTHKNIPGLRETVETILILYTQMLISALVRKSRVKLAENDRDLTHKTDEK